MPTARDREQTAALFSSVSSHSVPGRESATIPPPTPRCVRPRAPVPVMVNVRMATASSAASQAVSIQPIAPQ